MPNNVFCRNGLALVIFPGASLRRIAPVVGAHLTGQPLNVHLVQRSARLVRTTRTARGYSFFAMGNTTPAKPGLALDGSGAGSIEVEVWEMSAATFGSFVALTRRPAASPQSRSTTAP